MLELNSCKLQIFLYGSDVHICIEVTFYWFIMPVARKRYVVKHNLITEVYLMTM